MGKYEVQHFKAVHHPNKYLDVGGMFSKQKLLERKLYFTEVRHTSLVSNFSLATLDCSYIHIYI